MTSIRISKNKIVFVFDHLSKYCIYKKLEREEKKIRVSKNQKHNPSDGLNWHQND